MVSNNKPHNNNDNNNNKNWFKFFISLINKSISNIKSFLYKYFITWFYRYMKFSTKYILPYTEIIKIISISATLIFIVLKFIRIIKFAGFEHVLSSLSLSFFIYLSKFFIKGALHYIKDCFIEFTFFL
jgi:hypothetical protein